MPQRARAETTAALKASPTLTLYPGAPDNPSYHTLVSGPPMRPELAGLGCGAPPVVPLANLEVPVAGPWTLTAANRHKVHVVAPDGRCLGQTEITQAYQLQVGRYSLWGQLDARVPADSHWELELAHDERPLIFSTPPIHDLGTLETPLALTSTLTAPTFGPTRRVVCEGVSRTPNFFVRVPSDLGPISLEPLRTRGDNAPRMVVYGPLESMRPYQVWHCEDSSRAVLGAGSGT